MGSLSITTLLLALFVLLVTLGWTVFKQGRARSLARAAYFDNCKPLFTKLIAGWSPTGFARLSGQVQDVTIDLQVMPDTLTYRKLPALWLMATLAEPMPVGTGFHLMIRPRGVEPFSKFDTMEHQLAVPEGFPPDCAIRTDDPLQIPSEALLRRHLPLFADERMKELVISPQGLRLVWLAEEAPRGRYLIFRDAEMGLTPLPAAHASRLIAALRALKSDLAAEAKTQGAAA